MYMHNTFYRIILSPKTVFILVHSISSYPYINDSVAKMVGWLSSEEVVLSSNPCKGMF